MSRIENRTFDELHLGDTASIVRTLTYKDVQLFAVMSGDVNPAHLDEEFAKSDMFHRIIAHGMWGGALISTVLGTELPGPGTIYVSQSLKFRRPVGLGDTVTVAVTVAEKDEEKRRVTFACQATNQDGQVVISGTAEVIAPAEKISRERVALPEVKLLEKGKYYRQLLTLARDLLAIRVAIVHPVKAASLLGAIASAREGLIVPVLVGPAAKIRAAAEQAQVDLSGIELLPTEHSHAAVEVAVRLAHDGKVDALMQGNLSTTELMRAVVAAAGGLRTGRRMSHVTALDVPGFSRLLFLTDAALNIAPRLEEKRDIIQNAIDVALAAGIAAPKVAILSAVETVSPKLVSTLDAAILCKMAERAQIRGGVLDGPFGFDTAISRQAAAEKGIVSPVAGQADILVVPDVEAGNMAIKELEYLADADRAGIVLGARVPVVLVPRSATPLARLASSALALLVAHRRPQASG